MTDRDAEWDAVALQIERLAKLCDTATGAPAHLKDEGIALIKQGLEVLTGRLVLLDAARRHRGS